jgi:hypothetical protein
MGIFGDELLLNLVYEKNDINKPSIRIKKIKPNPEYLLPFSSVSILLSQLTVLTEWRNDLLATYILNFIQNQKVEYKLSGENCVSGFELSLFKKNSNFIYNQFDPSYYGIMLPSNDTLERDVVYTLYNYILWIYDSLTEREKKYLCVYLLLAIYFYKEQLQPIISKISKNGVLSIEQRKKIIADQVSISSMIYNKWHNPPLLHGTPNYEARINELKLMLKM